MSATDAAVVADALVWANLRGMDSHGVSRVRGYVESTPISIAMPGGGHDPLLLDMSTGVIPMGKLVQARRTGEPLPEGAALDVDGNVTTDAKRAITPLPLGGPKGSGLALMVECLTSLVLGNPIAADVLEDTARGRRHRQNCLALAIDVGRFGDPRVFQREAQRLIRVLKGLPRAAGIDEILMPGERGRRTLERRTRDGIPLPPGVVAELSKVADDLGVPMPAGL